MVAGLDYREDIVVDNLLKSNKDFIRGGGVKLNRQDEYAGTVFKTCEEKHPSSVSLQCTADAVFARRKYFAGCDKLERNFDFDSID